MKITTKVIQYVTDNFAFPFAFAGAFIYSLFIVLINMDKQLLEIVQLAIRQAIVTFPVTGLLVPYVRRVAVNRSGFEVYVRAVLFPATVVVIVSTLAHLYFTQESRNMLGPFLLSAGLNLFLVTACKAGHITFKEQTLYVLRGFR